jgi:hypothetical protein
MIEIRGQKFEDEKAVAKFFGMQPKSVHRQIRMGRAQTIGINKKGRPREPFTIRGEVFTSTREAAERFNVKVSTVTQAISNGRCDSIGQPKWNRKPITIDGVYYPSRFAAARAIGVSYEKVRHL